MNTFSFASADILVTSSRIRIGSAEHSQYLPSFDSRFSKFAIALVLFLMLGGCATTSSVFIPYPEQVNHKLLLLEQGRTTPDMKVSKLGANKLLNALEEGRVQQIQGNTGKSIEQYRHAIQLFERQNQQAIVDLSELGQTGASVVVNDNVRDYQGALFERTFLHLFQAQNYLFQNNLEAAGVEARRMNLVDKDLLAATRKKRLKAEERANDLPFNLNDESSNLKLRLQRMEEEAAKVKETYFSAYGYFMSALVYELSGYDNSAYIDYRKAYELAPHNQVVADAMIRLGLALGFNDDLPFSQQRIKAADYGNQDPEVILLYEEGFVPKKQEFSFPIYKYDGGVLVISMPGYFQYSFDNRPLTLMDAQTSGKTWQTSQLMSLQPIVSKALKDQQLSSVIRQALRVAAKNELQNKAEKEGGVLGGVVASLYNILSERADLRSWNSLPNNVQVARFFVPPGEHSFELSEQGRRVTGQFGQRTTSATNTSAEGNELLDQIRFHAKPGEKIVIRCIRVGNQFYLQQQKFGS